MMMKKFKFSNKSQIIRIPHSSDEGTETYSSLTSKICRSTRSCSINEYSNPYDERAVIVRNSFNCLFNGILTESSAFPKVFPWFK